ncbi:MAG: family 43 glycosylhydrolase [Lachnospiraceae bacterium]
MNRHFCNPINCEYKYQFNKNPMQASELSVNREAADPSIVLFKDKYYLFASMTLSVWVSEDLVTWESHRLPESLPLYDYAPDARVVGEYVYFTASDDNKKCSFFRTKDVLNGPYEEIPGTFGYTDPNLFVDEDGRIYFYWGCSSQSPLKGVELDPQTMAPIGEVKDLISSDAFVRGYERIGEDNTVFPASAEEVENSFMAFLNEQGIREQDLAEPLPQQIRGYLSHEPYIEGAWMNKFGRTYYLQYAFAGTEYNIYGDGVFESESPLGPFKLARNNPYSFSPGGYLPGAGHGSTFSDKFGNLWHSATMRISVNHNFERRVGIWPAGVDVDGELFCNQRYGDWPIQACADKRDPFEAPKWYLLSSGKKVTASSSEKKHPASLVAEEDVRTWWRASGVEPGEWLIMDLGQKYEVNAIQVNFADDHIELPLPKQLENPENSRYIEADTLYTRWILEGSADGEEYLVLADKSATDTDLVHDTVFLDKSMQLQYIRLTILEVPYGQQPCISGLRVFGKGTGSLPAAADYIAVRTSELDMDVEIKENAAVGNLILWGHAPDKLYHSCMVYGTKQHIGALVKDTDYYVRVDAFNENGITEGTVTKI